MSIYGNPVILGGSVGGEVAAIRCIYEAGTTATCTKGGKTLTGDASGNHIFLVSSAGTWTVSDGTHTRQVSVSLGQVYLVDLRTLLTASIPSEILTEAKGASFAAGDTAWGGFTIAGSGAGPGTDSGKTIIHFPDTAYATFDLGAENASFTAYLLTRQITVTNNKMLLDAKSSSSYGNNVCFMAVNGYLYYSMWGVDNSTGLSSQSYHVLTISVDGVTKNARYYVDGSVSYMYTLNFNNVGRYVSINATSEGEFSNDSYVSYAAVVRGVESASVILSNQQNIMSVLLS